MSGATTTLRIFRAEVVVMPKSEVADPQGQAIEAALARLPLTEGTPPPRASHVRVGKVFHLNIEAADEPSARRALELLADKVLHNPNTEEFTCSIGGSP